MIGRGFYDSAKVCVALHMPSSTFLVVKRTDLDVQSTDQLETLKHEVQMLRSLHHPNILPLYSTFIISQELWTIFPLMSYGSCADILSESYRDGMPEALIAAILKEVLQGLDYLHRMSIIHRGMKGGHVLVGNDGRVCLSGLRKSFRLDSNSSGSKKAHDFPLHAVDLLPWMAPEILKQDLLGYDCSADIYSIGILAIELAHGSLPYVGLPPTKVLLEKLHKASPSLCPTRSDASDTSTMHTTTTGTDTGSVITSLEAPASNVGQKKFSLVFHQFVDACVQNDPSLRPTSNSLACHSFIKQMKKKSPEILAELLTGVPRLTHRQEESSALGDMDVMETDLAAMSLDEWQ
ncbi:predicted protein, partial [Nematostella vectensis]